MKNPYITVLGDKNCRYYLAWFEQFDRHKTGVQTSWNWWAFAFTGAWALYRKMYGWCFAFCAIFTVAFILEKMGRTQFGLFILVLSSVVFAIFANSFYHENIKKKIAAAKLVTRDESTLLEMLRDQGGVNNWAIWFFIGGLSAGGWLVISSFGSHNNTTNRTVAMKEKSVNVAEKQSKPLTTPASMVQSNSISSLIDLLFATDADKTKNSVTATIETVAAIKTIDTKEKLIEHLAKQATERNKQGSVMVSQEIRRDKIEVSPNLQTTVYYSLPKHSAQEIEPVWIQKNLKLAVKKHACARTFQYGATYLYIYNDKEGQEIARFKIKKQDCHVATSKSYHHLAPWVASKESPLRPTKARSNKPVKHELYQTSASKTASPNKPCEIKVVMADEDYAACGLTPPTSSPSQNI
jgi:hypothetical protein